MAPDDWERHAIGDLLDSCTYGISSRLSTEPEGTPVLRMGNIADHRLDLADLKYADLSDKDPSDTLLGQGDVLFNRTNSADKVGKVALVDTDRPLGFASYLLRLRTNDSATPEWLYYLLSSPALQRRLRSLATRGVSQVNINPTRMRALQVTVPPLREQRKIAAILSSVDHLIETTEAVIEQLQVVKKAMMQDLLTRGLLGRHTRFKQTEIGEIPEEWKLARVEEVGAVSYGLTVNRARREAPDRRPYLTVANLQLEGLVLDEVKEIGVLDGDVERYACQHGDLLLVEGNGNPERLGRSAVWLDEIPGALHQNHLIRIRPDKCSVDPQWLSMCINAPAGRKQFAAAAKSSSGLYTINSTIVSSLLIPLPPMDLQEEIVESIGYVARRRESEAEYLRRLRSAKVALMEPLLTGEVRVTPDEAAA